MAWPLLPNTNLNLLHPDQLRDMGIQVSQFSPGDGWTYVGSINRRVAPTRANPNGGMTQVSAWKQVQAPAAQAAPPPPPAPVSNPISDAQKAIDEAKNREVAPYPDVATQVKTALETALGTQAASQKSILDEQAASYKAALDALMIQQTQSQQRAEQQMAESQQRLDQQMLLQLQIQQQAAAEKQALEQRMMQAQQVQSQQYQQQVGYLNQLMVQQQSQYQDQMAQARAQQAIIEARAAESDRQAAALQRAFVPNLEPTAAAPTLGDPRKMTTRRAANNTLSNLAVLTGLSGGTSGGVSSTLAGLQIA